MGSKKPNIKDVLSYLGTIQQFVKPYNNKLKYLQRSRIYKDDKQDEQLYWGSLQNPRSSCLRKSFKKKSELSIMWYTRDRLHKYSTRGNLSFFFLGGALHRIFRKKVVRIFSPVVFFVTC